MSTQSNTVGLKSLEPPDFVVPECRVQDAGALQDMLRGYIDNDDPRSQKRTKVQGLVDGNRPYSPARLKDMGKPTATNVNWGTGKSYLAQAEGIFFDLYSEAPTFCRIITSYGEDEQERQRWNGVMATTAHQLLSQESRWDYAVQCSQHYMTLHGSGPLWFQDAYGVIPRVSRAGDLKVPEEATSDTSFWELAFLLNDYRLFELYDFIKDEAAAKAVGWNVEYTKRVIMNATPKPQTGTKRNDWEYYQEKFKRNSFCTYHDVDNVAVAHCFWKEFDGRITHAIIEQEFTGTSSGTGSPKKPDSVNAGAQQYLFIHVGRYGSWDEILHPMWYDKGEGTHYSVTGMGVPMYSAMVLENRLRCNLADKAMSPKLLFKSNSDTNKPFNLKPMGDFALIGANYDAIQIPMNGIMEDGMVMLQEIQRTTSANLAQYRQGMSRDTAGNPKSATEIKATQAQQYAVAGTAIARYYIQLDHLYTEVVKRLCNLNTTDPIAIKFQEICEAKGVPREAFGRIELVEANRVAGQGSQMMRQAALDKLMGMINRLPEDGQDNLMEAWIASNVGQRNVKTFYPQRAKSGPMGSDAEADAMQQVASMKIGVPPVLAPHQNPVVYATVFLGSAAQALGTVQQGANPVEVLHFVDMAAPAGLAHLKRFANDPTRQDIVKSLKQMYDQIEKTAGQMKQAVQKMAQKSQEQKANGNGQNGSQLPPEIQQQLAIEDAKAKLKMQNMALSHRQRMIQKAEIHQQKQQENATRLQAEVAATDIRTAAEIRSNRLKAFSE